MKQLVPITAQLPTLIRVGGERAQARFWEFFVSNIRNPHTRRAYGRAIASIVPNESAGRRPKSNSVMPDFAATRGHFQSDIFCARTNPS